MIKNFKNRPEFVSTKYDKQLFWIVLGRFNESCWPKLREGGGEGGNVKTPMAPPPPVFSHPPKTTYVCG